jgi:transcriptional regulator with XRE-family HTH domain
MIMPPRLGEGVKQPRHARRLTLRHLADQVVKEDGTPISPQYLFDIEVHHRVSTLHVLRELARALEVDYDMLLALAGAADSVMRDFLEEYPQHTERDHLRQRIERPSKGGS